MNVEKWGMLELEFQGKADGNPYLDYEITADFTSIAEDGEKQTKTVRGFYNGNGIYKVRFMPEKEGKYSYEVAGSFQNENTDKSALSGDFECTPNVTDENGNGNHGPIIVDREVCLSYADGTPYYSMGTTCYAWVSQPMEIQEQTLETLRNSCFNKIRFCFAPKFYLHNLEEPISYPFERGEKRGQDPEQEAKRKNAPLMFVPNKPTSDITDFDCYRPNYEHFERFDLRISQLMEMGIEADLILLHPYDKWGFSTMNWECDKRYLEYLVARYSAYRNVWWSMANEYDLFYKPEGFWKKAGEAVAEADPYGHMISVHNCLGYYDFTEEWVKHCSMQRIDVYRHVEGTDTHLKEYKKPVVWDEIAYEGNIDQGWGNISGKELVRRFWEAFLRGGHAGHGETFLSEDDILWWAKGGVLKGESEPRIAFLLQVLKDYPGKYLKRATAGMWDEVLAVPFDEDRLDFIGPGMASYELHYYGEGRPSYRAFMFPEDRKIKVEVIDTWNMTIEDMGEYSGYAEIPLPGREYMAIRMTEVK